MDRGFDYEVSLPDDDVLHDSSQSFELGPYLVEVKATRSGSVRLTPLQAEKAASESERYVLCVADLREMSDEDIEQDWTAERVESLVRLVADIGNNVGVTYRRVESATELDVRIRNELALRYEVLPSNWETGILIAEWVTDIRQDLLKAV